MKYTLTIQTDDHNDLASLIQAIADETNHIVTPHDPQTGEVVEDDQVTANQAFGHPHHLTSQPAAPIDPVTQNIMNAGVTGPGVSTAPLEPPQLTPEQIAAMAPPQLTPTPVQQVATQATTAGMELDKDGVPWDDRIHAGTKNKTAKGLWTRKRGISDDDYNTITAALKAQAGGVVPQQQPVAPTPVAQQAAPIPAPQPESAPVQMPSNVVAAPMSFDAFMVELHTRMQSGIISAEYVAQVNQMHAISAIPELQNDPQKLAAIVAQYTADGKFD